MSIAPTESASEATSRPPAGARWWSLDIHAHSPASFDYGGLEGQESSVQKPTFGEWVQAYIDAGVDGIVITDHNTHAGIDAARQALGELEADKAPSLTIFPGVEVTATGGIHVLGIFDPSVDADVINQLLARCNYSGTRGSSDQTANMTVIDIAEEVARLGGICIPAHADQARGIFSMDPRDLAALAKSPHVFAAEVITDGEGSQTAARLDLVPLLGSDAHHLSTDLAPQDVEAKAPGSHLTLIKAERLDLSGIRLALTDPLESVKRVRIGYENPNTVAHEHINRVEISRRDNQERYNFGPWMNCVIGGRGVGKSTLIEILRLALGRSDEVEGSVADDLLRFSPEADPLERWWDEDTKVVVYYTKDQRQLRVTWSGSEPNNSKLELLVDETWEEQSGKVNDRTPVRIFSQKQIYDLATSPRSFLRILDDMPEIERTEWDETYKELQLRYRGERNKLRQLLAETERADRLRGELQEVQGRLRHLEQLRASDEFRELEVAERRIRDAASADEQSQNIERRLLEDSAALRRITSESLQETLFSQRSQAFEVAAGLMEQAATLIAEAKAEWDESGTAQTWGARVDELSKWLSAQGGANAASAEQTRVDRQRETTLQDALRAFDNSATRRADQETHIEELYGEIRKQRGELFSRRRDYTAGLSASADALTKVEVYQQGDVGEVGDELRHLLNCPESFESAFGRDGIASSLLANQPKSPQFPKKVEEFKQALLDFVQRGPTSAIGRSITVDRRFYTRLSNADTFDLETSIMLWFPEDLVSVRYRPRPGQNFIAVDQGSPGQKTAALLTVILQMGSDPLLLDQPEDDLENKLIRHLAVETLKNIKRRRQLVVSTHNANIVVTSAAENILVLKHGENVPGVDAAGTLQSQPVRSNVCEILEGGEEAIKTRYSRLVTSS